MTNRTATRKTKTTKNHAPTAYAARRQQVAEQIARLTKGLEREDAAAKADPKNWGHVGDLGRVLENLTDLADCLLAEGEYHPDNIYRG